MILEPCQMQQYLSSCEKQKNLDKKTIKAYRIDLQQLSDYLTQEGVCLHQRSILAYIEQLHGRYKPSSIKRKIASIKAFCRYLFDQKVLSSDLFYGLRFRIQQPRLLPRTVPLRVIQAMLSAAHADLTVATDPKHYDCALRDVVVLELLFATGMRVSELCGLCTADIDAIEGTIRIYGKGSKERIIQVENAEVLHWVAQRQALSANTVSNSLLLNRRGLPLSDQSVRLILNRYATRVGSELHVTPHMFRHSFATLLLEADVDIRYIQQFLGHSSISTTQIYTYVSTTKQRRILAAKHPRNHISFP